MFEIKKIKLETDATVPFESEKTPKEKPEPKTSPKKEKNPLMSAVTVMIQKK